MRRYLPRSSSFFYYLLLGLLAIPFAYPFYWMISSSFKPENELLAIPPSIIPETFTFDNYTRVFDLQPFARQFANSLYIALAATALTLVVASLAGYAFARLRFPGANIVFLALLAAILLPAEVTIIPVFFLFQDLGMLNNHVPLILLPVFGAQGIVAMFLLRQHYLSLPKDLEEAAQIDGLSTWGVYWKIAFPLARPALAAVAVLTFLQSWNLFLEPLVLIRDEELFTLPLALSSLTNEYGVPFLGSILAATAMSTVPVLIVYLAAQKQIENAFTFTAGTKG